MLETLLNFEIFALKNSFISRLLGNASWFRTSSTEASSVYNFRWIHFYSISPWYRRWCFASCTNKRKFVVKFYKKTLTQKRFNPALNVLRGRYRIVYPSINTIFELDSWINALWCNFKLQFGITTDLPCRKIWIEAWGQPIYAVNSDLFRFLDAYLAIIFSDSSLDSSGIAEQWQRKW